MFLDVCVCVYCLLYKELCGFFLNYFFDWQNKKKGKVVVEVPEKKKKSKRIIRKKKRDILDD